MATATKATTKVPAKAAGPGEIEGRVIRGLAAACPAELARDLEKLAGRQRGTLAHVAAQPFRGGPEGTARDVREAVRALRLTEARIAHLARLAAGDGAAGFAPPGPDPDGEAAEVLKGLLGPGRLPELVRMVDATLAAWGAERDGLRAHPAGLGGELTAASAEWVRGVQGNAVELLDEQVRRLARDGELAARASALAAARDRMEAAIRRRVAEAVEAAGGVPSLVVALREASALADASIQEGREEMARELRLELSEVEGKLAKLGVDPAEGPESGGRMTRALLLERAELAGRIEALRSGAASKEASDAGAILEAALSFSPTAWSEVLGRARAVPSAFPEGFAASWGAIALGSLVEAGAADFVGALESD